MTLRDALQGLRELRSCTLRGGALHEPRNAPRRVEQEDAVGAAVEAPGRLHQQRFYEGQYEEGVAHGQGQSVSFDGSRYDGGWANGKHEGTGKKVYGNGSTYEGGWENNKEHGKGKITHFNGKVFECEWDRGTPLYIREEGHVDKLKDIEAKLFETEAALKRAQSRLKQVGADVDVIE